MKKRTKIVFIIAAAVLPVLVFAACDVLVAPIKERLNPNDSENPIPAASGFTATLGGSVGDRYVDMAWGDGTSEVDTNISGYLIVRKAGEAPDSIWDGNVVDKINYGDGTSITDDDVDYDDEYPRGYRVYYSVFTYGTDDDTASSLEIDYDSGTINNADYYDFTGPVSASVVVTESKYFYVEADGYIDSGSNWYMEDESIYLGCNASIATSIGFITFDIDEIIGSEVVSAIMGLTTYDAPSGTMGFDIAIMDIDWDGGTWTNLYDSSAIDADYTEYISSGDIPTTAPEYFELDLKSLTQAWCSGIKSNNGIRMIDEKDTTTGAYEFQSNEHSGDKPELMVTYYFE